MNETVDPNSVKGAEPSPLAPSPRRYRVARLAFWLAVAIAAAALGYHWIYPAPTPSSAGRARGDGAPPQSVRTVAADIGQMPIVIDALGVVTPFVTVTVKTQVAGRLMSVGFQEGQLVKKGVFLAQIDPRPYQATLEQAQANLAKDTALRDQAQADLARYVTLSKQDSISHQQVDDQKFLAAQYAAAMQSDQAQIDAAQLNIEYAHIVSPIDGRIGLRLVDPGNYVQPSDATGLFVITELDPISVIFSTPEDNLQRIARRLKEGGKLPVAVYDRANVKKITDGDLTTYDNEIDTTTGTFKLRASFSNPDNALFPSQFVNARLLVDTLENVIMVPNAAVQLGAAGAFVYVVKDDGTVNARKITTGPSDSARTVIETGLQVGEKVVIDGVDRLRDGSKVRAITGETSADAPVGTPGKSVGFGQHHRRQPGETADAPAPQPSASAKP